MESTDEKILALLARAGRMSYTDIGRETELSTSAAQQRVRRLEHRGAITGYHASIDPEALGRMLTAFVQLKPFDPAEPDDIPAKLAAFPEIVSCYSIAGEASYLLKVQIGTPMDLEALLAKIRTTAGCGTHTTLVLSIPFRDRPLV